MSLPSRSPIEDRRLLYAISDFLSGAGDADFSVDWDDVQNKPSTFPTDWGDVQNKPSTFPPSAHAVSHELGGGDVLAIDWTQLANVPGSFPPSAHASSHIEGAPDEVIVTRLTGTDSGFMWAAIDGQNFRIVRADGEDDTRSFAHRFYAGTATVGNGWAGTFQSQGGSWPTGQPQWLRMYARSGGNGFGVTYADGTQEIVQTSSFSDEVEGLPETETPRDFLFQQWSWVRQCVLAIVAQYNANKPPGKPNIVLPPNPYPTHVVRPVPATASDP